MSFSVEEKSVESGRPVEVYELRLGSDTYRYASCEDDVTVDGNVWEAIPLRRSSIPISPEARTQPIEVTMPASNEFAQKYVDAVPSSQATLQIFRAHRGDLSEKQLLFKGVVRTVKFEGNGTQATLLVVPMEGGLAKSMPRIDFCAQCNHILFDARCKAVPASFRYIGTVASVSGSEIVVTGLDSAVGGAGWATAGEVVSGNGDRRLVIRHTATDTLQLLFPFEDDVAGENVEVYAGCDHEIATCNSKFSNAINFGGFAYVPPKNPFATGLD